MSTHESILSDERFVLAFYGVAPSPESSASFFRIADQWLSELGYAPDKIAVVGKGHSGKVGEYRRSKAKLEVAGFSGVKSFDIHASKPNASIPGMNYFASATFSHADDDGGYAVIAIPSALAASEKWLPVALKIILDVCPVYGIGFERDLRQGPVKYALGICQGLGTGISGETYEEARNISRWCDMGMVKQVYREGLLREVYRWNFLTQPQLSKAVASVSLEQWIRQDANRGVLRSLCDRVSLWELEEAQLPAIRKTLFQAGVIFDWRNWA